MNKMKTLITLALVCFFALQVDAQTKKPVVKKSATTKTIVKKPAAKRSSTTRAKVIIPGTRVKVTTDSGVMIIRLYDKTPLHRDNFIKLANDHFFDSLLFHRVIQGFMLQGGDPQSKYAQPGQMLAWAMLDTSFRLNLIPAYFIKKGRWLQPELPTLQKPAVAASFILYRAIN